MGYIEDIRKLVGHRPLILVGATAVISDDRGRILLQERRFPEKFWGIPGGLMELGETTEETAKREVREESGLEIDHLQLLGVYTGSTGSRGYSIAQNGDQYCAVTIAYYTRTFRGTLIVDPAESIKFEFRDPADLPEHLLKSSRLTLQDYFSKIKD